MSSERAPSDVQQDVTRLLIGAAADGAAAAQLLPLVYQELRELARQRLSREGRDGQDVIQATALVHEAYMRLVVGDVPWNGRGHFFGAAAEAMRRILIEHARARRAQKRGGDAHRVELGGEPAAEGPSPGSIIVNHAELLALDAALTRLESKSPRAASVVKLRHFAGLGVDETAECLGISPRTVDNDWSFARVWLEVEVEICSQELGGEQ